MKPTQSRNSIVYKQIYIDSTRSQEIEPGAAMNPTFVQPERETRNRQ
jgi:hypothetical protein